MDGEEEERLWKTKIVFSDSLRMNYSLPFLASTGARGVICISPDLSTNESRWNSEIPCVYVSPKVGKELKSAGYVDGKVKLISGLKGATCSMNVVGCIKAPEAQNPLSEYVVLGAHYEHLGIRETDSTKVIMYGADDNASGIAMLLAMGRYFGAHQQELTRDVVLVAFGAEERGLLGAYAFVNHPLIPMNKITAMFNFDMVGRMKNRTLEVAGLGVVKGSFRELSTLMNPDNLDFYLQMSGSRGTDYAAFNANGIPALSFSTGLHKDYHQATDTEDKINYDGMEQVYRYVLPLVRRFAMGGSSFVK